MPNARFSPELLEAIRTNTYIEAELDLSNQPLSAENMAELVAALEMNTHIKSLVMRQCCMGDRGARILAANTTLTTLDVSANQIRYKGARYFATNTTLATLDLCANDIRYKGAEALAANTTLATLNVRRNDIGLPGVEALAKNSTLSELDISGNFLGKKGAAFLTNRTLTKLEVCEFEDPAIREALDAMVARNMARKQAATADLAVLASAADAVLGTGLEAIGDSIQELTGIIRDFAGFSSSPENTRKLVATFGGSPFFASLVEEKEYEMGEKVKSDYAIS